ncbi:MAG: TonB-dependent receptor [Porphyromonas sp.]|nr:TonB-dependent receptor [Porphyromonas sp.]
MIKETILLGTAFVLGANTLVAQAPLKGRVLDAETGEVLPGASLRALRGKGAVSDLKGQYQIQLAEGDSVDISFVGYETIRLSAEQLRRQRDVRLTAGRRLQDLVVTASIASARSSKAVGSKVDRVDVARLSATGAHSNLSELLDGRVSGVQMFQSNGKVGMPIRFNMRSGATFSMDRDPIIYVDGIRYHSGNTSDINSAQDALSGLNDLPMEDIASIDVIKGPAAAASYGAEAANGVIVITTKRGGAAIARGDKRLGLELKYSLGQTELVRKYDQFVNNDALNGFFVKGMQHKLYAGLSKQLAEGNKLFVSANYHDVAGIVPGNRDKRGTLRAAYDLRQGPLTLDLTASYTNGDISLPQTAMGRYDAIWNLMINQKPWPYVDEQVWRAQSWRYANDRILGTARAGYVLPHGFKLETLLGLDLNYIKGTYLLPYGYLLGNNSEGAKNVSNRRNSNLNWDVKLNKRLRLGEDWLLNATLLSQLVRRYEESYVINASRFGGDVDNVSAARERQVSETSYEQRTWGLYGELFFGYRDKLFINLGLRRDASNLIGANVASILYPSLSVSYNWERLKLRTAYGESGRLPQPNDAYTSYIMQGTSAYGTLVKPQYLGNPDIRPERSREWELGADLSLGRHQLSLTGYMQWTSDAIIYEEQLASDGWVGSKPRNVGSIRGLGAELSYNGRLWETRDKANSLDVYASVNYQTNEVTDTGGQDIVNVPNIIRKGLPVYAFYYRTVTGPAYNTDDSYNAKVGALESSEQSYLGKPFPDFNGSFGFDLRFARRFTLGAKLSYALGASVYNQTLYNVAGLGDNLRQRYEQLEALKAQTVGTPEYRAVAEQLATTARFRANYIEPADFLRLSSLSLSCDLGDLARRYSEGAIKGARLSLSAQNLWLITNYSGAEPQVESNSGKSATRAVGNLSRDITNAPTPRTIVGTLTLQF